ncbi:MAG: tetratricopeptide repeat protein [Planctomycetota bacterium]|nr:tetratricopeptide repeat protein [Planctomycetota bacterium]MDA1214917.1 tetratricopeptide repeat protein [Planctomycetota bacterium]
MQTIRRKFGLTFAIAVVVVAGLIFYLGWNRESPPPILLITLDTTRADRIGAYGYDKAHTPVLDQLAREGILFEDAVSPAPLTLPVHASLFTGLYPPEHGLRTNGYGSLPKQFTTLGEILSDAGYDSGAFVASFVLNGKFGLRRGFREYDDNLSSAAPTQDAIHRFRDGGAVVDSALKWLEKPRSKPFFCWVHLYDPHAPYDPRTNEFGDEFVDSPYDGEIAYTDRQVGRLLDFLKTYPETIVIVVGDHGESLGDHFEMQHGYTLYNSTQHVPLIMRGVPETIPGSRIAGSVSLVDILPTVTEMLKLPAPETISGRSFLPALRGDAPAERLCYGGTDDPYLQNGWSPLRSLTTQRWRYIRTTKPELYDLENDPKELDNLAAKNPQRLKEMEIQLADLESSLNVGEADEVQLSNAEQRGLESLGYAGGSSRGEATTDNNLPDVKDMLPFNLKTQTAIDLMDQGKFSEAEAVLQEIVAASPPEHFSSRLYLGAVLEHQGHFDEAETIYKAVLDQRPEDTNALFHLGAMYAVQGRFPEAIEIFEKSLATEPDAAQPLFNLGLAHARLGEFNVAEQNFNRVLQLDPAFPGAWMALGNLRARQGLIAEAITAYEYELRLNPASVETHVNLGVQLASQQRHQEAQRHLAEAVRLAPQNADARYNLGICEEMLQHYDAAISELQEAIRLRPDQPGLKTALGNIYSKADQLDEAIKMYEAEVEKHPEAIDAYVNLGVLHAGKKQLSQAVEYLEKALELSPDHAEARFNLGSIFAMQNERDKAKEQFERILRRHPDHESAAKELARLRSESPP